MALILKSIFQEHNSLKNEFEELLLSMGQAVLLNDKYPQYWEFVYGLRLPSGTCFKIYSSISLNTGKFRPSGRDAIKIIPWNPVLKIPLRKSIKIYRTEKWKSNLMKTILKYSN